jgi:hypothetical protein
MSFLETPVACTADEGTTSHVNISCQIKFEINHYDIISLSKNTWGNWMTSMTANDANDTNIASK